MPAEKKQRGPSGTGMPREVTGILSASSIAKGFLAVLIAVACIVLVYLLREVILLLFLGLFVAIIVDPGVQALKRWGAPESLAILFQYAVFLGCAAILVVSLIPIIAEQLTALAALTATQLGDFLKHPYVTLPYVSPGLNVQLTHLAQTTLEHLSIERLPDALHRLSTYLTTLAAGGLQFATGVAGSVFTFLLDLIVVLLFAFFLETERTSVTAWVTPFLSPRSRAYVEHKASLIHHRLAQWAKGQLVLCLVIGVMVYIMLLILQVPYALTLAILAAFTEFIPYVGPLIAAVPGILVAVAQHGFAWGLIVAVAYYAVQWSENNIIVPIIMKHATNLSAVAIMFAMLVAVSFPSFIHPILGILLSIPVTSIIAIFLEDLRTWISGSPRPSLPVV
jgi:predicted PurR-regulated permease PerM